MSTALQIIKRSLRMLGVLASGETPDGSTGSDSLFALNRILEEWNTQRLLSYYVKNASYTLTANDGQYTIGNGADLDGDRPVKICSAFIRDSNNRDYNLKIITDTEYNKIFDKTEVGICEYIRYAPQYPSGVINLFPIPDYAYTLNLSYYLPIGTISLISDSVNLPDGYETALIYQLAAELAPEFGKSPEPFFSQSLQKKSYLKAINTEIDKIGVDNALLFNVSGYNIASDTFAGD